MARILVAYDTVEGQTRKIADYIARRVEQRGHDVSLVKVSELPRVSLSEAFDGTIIGASIHVGKHSPRLVQLVANRPMWLEGMPVAFFSVSLSASGSEQEQEEARGYVNTLLEKTGWQPQSAVTIGGGLRYRSYGFLKRLIMRRIARQAGRDTDTSRDHEYTNWQYVDRFTDDFVGQFGSGENR